MHFDYIIFGYIFNHFIENLIIYVKRFIAAGLADSPKMGTAQCG